MIPALVILIISFVAIITMLVARHHEIKIGRQVLAVKARDWAEKQARQGLHAAKGVAKVAATKHFWTGLSNFVCQIFITKVWQHPRVCVIVKKTADTVRGKKEINSKGPVSFYLKDVSEYKNKVRQQ